MTADVSVIIPVLDRPVVSEAIASSLDQAGVNVEVIVVDDGSTDGTAELLDSIGAAHPAVSIIHQPNRGQSSARNRGVAASSAPHVTFLDSDDLMLPGRLRRQLDALDRAGVEAFVIGNEELHAVGDVAVPEHDVRRQRRGERRYLTSVMLARTTFDAVGGFDEELRLGEDVDLVVRLAETGVHVIELDEAIVVRRFFGDNLVCDAGAVNASLFEVYRRRVIRHNAAQSRSADKNA